MREQVSFANRCARALHAWPGGLAREFENSPIRFTAAFSITAHAIVLLLGYSQHTPYAIGELDSIPTLSVALIEGHDEDNENPPPPMEQLAQAARAEAPVAAPADDLHTEVDPTREPGKSEPPRPHAITSTASGSALPAEIVVADSGAAEPSELITTSAISEHSVPAPEIVAAISKPAIAVSIPTDQQRQIAKKVLRWAQGLKEIDDASSQLLWQQDGREYTAVLKHRPAGSSSEYDGASVEISTSEHGQQLRTSMQLRRLAFSHFTQFVDEWDSAVQLHDDEVIGRFHSNSRLTIGLIRTAPRFTGKVTTAAFDYSIGGFNRFKARSEIFQGGFEAGAGRINLPHHFVQFGSNPAMNDARVRSFERDTRIAFYSDGTYGWQPMASGSVETRRPLGDEPLIIVATENAELHVHGVVKGTVLIYSPQRIWVDDDLTYATNPRMVPDSKDYTGIVSDKFVDIAGPQSTGPGDLLIDAAIYARRSFTVRDEYAGGGTRATLRIYGSLTAGTLSATEPRYATHLEFDPRLERRRPPGFPMTNRYEVEEWDGQWVTP